MKSTSEKLDNQDSSKKMIWLMAAATALASGNLYYSQPLLNRIAQRFVKTASEVGSIPTLTQFGYVIGLIFLCPLGDIFEKRRLISLLMLSNALLLAVVAISPTLLFFAIISFFVGISAVSVQVLIPFVAALSPESQRSKNLSIVLGGALVGILISRTFSGWIGEHFGWRAVYFVAAPLILILGLFLSKVLPQSPPHGKMKYSALLSSLWHLYKSKPELKNISINGALVYAALCGFWATLSFYLNYFFNEGPQTVGTFGLVGAGSAILVVFLGRIIAHWQLQKFVLASIATMIVSYSILWRWQGHWTSLVLGVIGIDFAAQAVTVANQSQIYSYFPNAQSRVNTIYKVHYMIGGAIGTGAATVAWQKLGWDGVCVVAIIFLLASMTYVRLKNERK